MKKIIVLGGGADQIDLIKDLKQRGYYTILIDYYTNPIAKKYADEHIQESTLDMDKVLSITQEKEAENIITACTDQALLTVAYVAEKMNFHTQFSYNQALNLTNKLHMKEMMWKAGIPTSKFIKVKDVSEGIADLKYPLMVKPADCNGSFGVRKVNSFNELKGFFEYASKASRTGQVIIEEFKEGKEVGIDCFVKDGKAQILMYGEVRKKKIGDHILLIFQTYIPAKVSKKALENIQKIADDIAKTFELNNTPLLIQTLVDEDDVNVIEFAARIGGASKHRTITFKTGFDILHANIDVVLGFTPEIKLKPSKSFFSRNHIYTYPSTFDHFENHEDLIKEGTIKELIPYKTSGMTTGDTFASRERVGSFLVEADTMEQLEEKIAKAVKEIRVIDSNGNDVMKREIFDGNGVK